MPHRDNPQTPPPLPSSPPSIVLSQPATPKAPQASSSVTGQQAAGGRRPIFGAEGIESVLKDVSEDEKGFAFMSAIVKVLGETLDQTSASASQQGQDMMAQLFKHKIMKCPNLDKLILQRLVRLVCQSQPQKHPLT